MTNNRPRPCPPGAEPPPPPPKRYDGLPVIDVRCQTPVDVKPPKRPVMPQNFQTRTRLPPKREVVITEEYALDLEQAKAIVANFERNQREHVVTLDSEKCAELAQLSKPISDWISSTWLGNPYFSVKISGCGRVSVIETLAQVTGPHTNSGGESGDE